MVKPIFGQPTEAEFVVELGRRLELKDTEGHEFFWNNPITGEREENLSKWYEAFFSKEIINGAPKMTLEEFKKLPGAVWTTGKTEYEKYKKEIDAEKLATSVVEKAKVKISENGEGKEAKGRGSSDANLRATKSDPIGGQALHKECCVKIYKV